MCVLCLPRAFGCLLTRECFGLAHAPHLLIKPNEHSYLCSHPLVRSASCDEGAFGHAHAPILLIKTYKHSCLCFRPLVRSACPWTSPPHKGVRAFVNMCSSSLVRSSCVLIFPCTRLFTCAVISKARRVVINEPTDPKKRATR